MNNALLYIILIIIFGLALVFFIPQFMVRRAATKVIKIFLKKNAISPQTAMTLAELKLQPGSYISRLMSLRDYKPAAIDMLIKANIIIVTVDEKYYLSEPALLNTALGRKIKRTSV